MGTNQLANLRYLAVKDEVTEGTFVAAVDADFNTRLRDIQITPNVEMDDENSKWQTGDHGEDEHLAGVQAATITFYQKLTWGGAVNTSPSWTKIMEGCGCPEEAYGAAGIGWAPKKVADELTKSITVADVTRGATPITTLYKFAGCMGNAIIMCEGIGKPWLIRYTFQGKIEDIVDGTALVLTSPQETLAEVMLSNTFTIGGTAERISSFQLDLGNEIAPVYDQSKSNGILHFGIVNRRPRFSCNPLAVKQATRDMLNLLITNNVSVISNATSHMTIAIPAAQLLNPGLAAREGLVNWEENYRCLRNGNYNPEPITALDAEDTWELLQGARS